MRSSELLDLAPDEPLSTYLTRSPHLDAINRRVRPLPFPAAFLTDPSPTALKPNPKKISRSLSKGRHPVRPPRFLSQLGLTHRVDPHSKRLKEKRAKLLASGSGAQIESLLHRNAELESLLVSASAPSSSTSDHPTQLTSPPASSKPAFSEVNVVEEDDRKRLRIGWSTSLARDAEGETLLRRATREASTQLSPPPTLEVGTQCEFSSTEEGAGAGHPFAELEATMKALRKLGAHFAAVGK